jgi:hypothetical protein
MTTDPMPEPEGAEDERFVYVVTAAGVEALREGAVAFDSEREALDRPPEISVATSRGSRAAWARTLSPSPTAGPRALPTTSDPASRSLIRR